MRMMFLRSNAGADWCLLSIVARGGCNLRPTWWRLDRKASRWVEASIYIDPSSLHYEDYSDFHMQRMGEPSIKATGKYCICILNYVPKSSILPPPIHPHALINLFRTHILDIHAQRLWLLGRLKSKFRNDTWAYNDINLCSAQRGNVENSIPVSRRHFWMEVCNR